MKRKTPSKHEIILDNLFAQAPNNAFASTPKTRAAEFERALARPAPKAASRPAPTTNPPPASFPTAASIALEMVKAAQEAARAPRPLEGLAKLIDIERRKHDAAFDASQKKLTVSLAKRGNETGLARLISAAKLKTALGK
jgi:hypothetical protein